MRVQHGNSRHKTNFDLNMLIHECKTLSRQVGARQKEVFVFTSSGESRTLSH